MMQCWRDAGVDGGGGLDREQTKMKDNKQRDRSSIRQINILTNLTYQPRLILTPSHCISLFGNFQIPSFSICYDILPVRERESLLDPIQSGYIFLPLIWPKYRIKEMVSGVQWSNSLVPVLL